jgi:hypothetical protein
VLAVQGGQSQAQARSRIPRNGGAPKPIRRVAFGTRADCSEHHRHPVVVLGVPSLLDGAALVEETTIGVDASTLEANALLAESAALYGCGT